MKKITDLAWNSRNMLIFWKICYIFVFSIFSSQLKQKIQILIFKTPKSSHLFILTQFLERDDSRQIWDTKCKNLKSIFVVMNFIEWLNLNMFAVWNVAVYYLDKEIRQKRQNRPLISFHHCVIAGKIPWKPHRNYIVSDSSACRSSTWVEGNKEHKNSFHLKSRDVIYDDGSGGSCRGCGGGNFYGLQYSLTTNKRLPIPVHYISKPCVSDTRRVE